MTADNAVRTGRVVPAVDAQGTAIILIQSEGNTLVLAASAALDLADAIKELVPDAELMAKVFQKVLTKADS